MKRKEKRKERNKKCKEKEKKGRKRVYRIAEVLECAENGQARVDSTRATNHLEQRPKTLGRSVGLFITTSEAPEVFAKEGSLHDR